jgi:hypothetical protein
MANVIVLIDVGGLPISNHPIPDKHQLGRSAPPGGGERRAGRRGEPVAAAARARGRRDIAARTGTHRGRAFIADKDAILAALSERHGFPDPHP